ncbi:serine--tRNA ligase [Lyngbya sp. PCC 8106]|uniref:serine--tRNA ligase n=1 Tax=Lyngbya sp. (strain PCC 8106) TaxID=313612 RepID=UPI0000EAA182|nr:serine--tRNA ligase [Lyngbya sp. PCC 8106]EAW37848.1 seryl-tRNA synthetase [Lyngbya sp. PCC 8106]
MLDIKQIRENPQAIQDRLKLRGDYDLQPILDLDERRRELEKERIQLETRSNEIGKQVGEKIKSGSDPKGAEIQALKEEGQKLRESLSELEPKEKKVIAEIEALLLPIPNLPSESTPFGKSEEENVEVRRWGDEYLPENPKILPHWEIGENLGILNFERGVKIAQSRFVSLIGAGAALERALVQFMLDTHTSNGYVEVMPPLLVNSTSLQGTGQLPKFAEESFKCSEDDLWLIPTSEVPVVNFYRDEILDGEQLPIYHCSFTPCFRREAGSYGKDTRGLIRLHQFHKVELIKLVRPETSEAEHEKLVQDAEGILQALKLPYRVIELCTGDLGFSAAKCYDIEVWLPSSQSYREISSCSNVKDFQPRRANIRFKESKSGKKKKKTEFVHALNGSGLAIGRTMAAILENYQQPDGSVRIPEVLQPYMKRETL